MPILPMTPGQRKALRARAHALDPVVIVSTDGLSAGVLNEIDRSLKAHELIKVRAPGEDRHGREALLAEICSRTGAEPIQHIGKVLVIYREKPGEERPQAAASMKEVLKERSRRARKLEHLQVRRARPPRRPAKAPRRRAR